MYISFACLFNTLAKEITFRCLYVLSPCHDMMMICTCCYQHWLTFQGQIGQIKESSRKTEIQVNKKVSRLVQSVTEVNLQCCKHMCKRAIKQLLLVGKIAKNTHWQDGIVFWVPIKQKYTPPGLLFSDFAGWVIREILQDNWLKLSFVDVSALSKSASVVEHFVFINSK